MNDRVFVDTNVPIYAHDVQAGRKREVASALLRDLWQTRSGVVSAQVLQEFYVNGTLAGNAAMRGGAIFDPPVSPSSIRIDNSILWDDWPNEIVAGDAEVAFSDVAGGYAGEGNLNADPRFVDLAELDLHLTAGSPCIDRAAGDLAPPLDLDGNARYDDPATPNHGMGEPPYADLGAFEYQGSAGRW